MGQDANSEIRFFTTFPGISSPAAPRSGGYNSLDLRQMTISIPGVIPVERQRFFWRKRGAAAGTTWVPRTEVTDDSEI